MKTVTVKSFFKKVSAKQAEANPSLADKVGVKRPDLNWSYESPEVSDIPQLNQEHVAFFLAKAIEDYGRALIASPDNLANWEYVPGQEELTLAKAFEAANAERSGSRTLTKVTATIFAKFYSAHAPELLGIKKEAALAAEGVLVDWLKMNKKEDIRKAMHARLNQFAEALADLDEDSEILRNLGASDTDLTAVLGALINAFAEDKTMAEITADAL